MQTRTPVPPVPSVVGPEPLMPMCVFCGNRRGPLVPSGARYDSGAQQFVCPTPCTAGPPEPDICVVRTYDGLSVEAIAEAACDHARAEVRAETDHLTETVEWFHRQWLATAPLHAGREAVHALCAGRPGFYHLPVSEILSALDGRPHTTAGGDRALRLTWDGLIAPPVGDRPDETTLIGCQTTFGGAAVLALDDDQRTDLAARLLATVHQAEACATPGCGSAVDDLDETDPSVWGWILVDVVGTEGGPRWWCTPLCASAAMAAAGAELAAADQAAATDPAEDATAVEDDVARCARCGCTEERACEGGCHWIPTIQHIELCSACATPDELAYAGIRPQSGQGAAS